MPAFRSKSEQGCTNRSRWACSMSLLSTETGLRCRSHLLSDRCCAGNPLWQAPGCYKWADALRDSAKAKNFIPSSDSCVADRKMRTTPPRSFSSSPYDAQSHCVSRACTTRSLTVTGCLLKVPTLSLHTHTDTHTDEWTNTSTLGAQTNVTMRVPRQKSK